MKQTIFTTLLSILLIFSSCSVQDEGIITIDESEYISYSLNMENAIGFDDLSSKGAALAVAVDTKINAALVIACKFTIPEANDSLIAGNNVALTLSKYSFSKSNSITTPIIALYPYLSTVITNTAGIRTMNNNLTAFLVIKSASSNTPDKILVAVDGNLSLTRYNGTSDIVEGGLRFVEVTDASSSGMIKADGLKYYIDNIYVKWDTTVQPQ